MGFRGVARVRGSESDPYEEESDFFPALNLGHPINGILSWAFPPKFNLAKKWG